MSETELLKRVEKLERDNRRMKSFGLAALILVTAFTSIYATQAVPDVIKAHKFLIVDNTGTPRAWLDVTPDKSLGKPTGRSHAELVMAQPNGRRTVNLHGERAYSASVTLSSKSYPIQIAPGLDIFGGGGGLGNSVFLSNSGVSIMQAMVQGHRHLSMANLSAGELQINAAQPSLKLSDDQGFEMDLGSAETVIAKTGQTRKTSADSIVMFGNDKKHHVIWEAP